MVICGGVHRAVQVLPLPSSHHLGTPVSDWEKLGHEGVFCGKVEGGKDFFFTEHHIFCLQMLSLGSAFFSFVFICFSLIPLILQRCIFCLRNVICVFVLYQSCLFWDVFYFELDDTQHYKTFFCLLALLAASKPTGIFLPYRPEFTQNPFNHYFIILTLSFCAFESHSFPVVLLPLPSCKRLENIQNRNWPPKEKERSKEVWYGGLGGVRCKFIRLLYSQTGDCI